jgi:hypothetical protein
MTLKSAIEGKKDPAAPAAGRSGVKTRANASKAASSKVAKKTVKPSPEVLTEDARYELAREAAENRVKRHAQWDRLRGGA